MDGKPELKEAPHPIELFAKAYGLGVTAWCRLEKMKLIICRLAKSR